MVRKRVALAALGAVAIVLGVATAAAPALAGVLAVPNVPIVLVGGIAGLFAVLVALRRRDSTIRGAEPPAVEETLDYPAPGAAFDEQLRGATGIGVDAARHRRLSRERLARVAVAVLGATEGYTEEEADAALAAGTWTDDPVAASCFADESVRRGIRGAVAQYFDRRSRYERELVHAIDALQAKLTGRGES